jgi:hypothetical protein
MVVVAPPVSAPHATRDNPTGQPHDPDDPWKQLKTRKQQIFQQQQKQPQ